MNEVSVKINLVYWGQDEIERKVDIVTGEEHSVRVVLGISCWREESRVI